MGYAFFSCLSWGILCDVVERCSSLFCPCPEYYPPFFSILASQCLVLYFARRAIREDPDGIVPLPDFYPTGRTNPEPDSVSRVKENFGRLSATRLHRSLLKSFAMYLEFLLTSDSPGSFLAITLGCTTWPDPLVGHYP